MHRDVFGRNPISGTQTFYNAWGHSGGAQFLHRFALFVPNSKLGVGVCSNAGWYTVPETGVDYPYGISLPFGPSNQDLFDFLQSPANDLNINLESSPNIKSHPKVGQTNHKLFLSYGRVDTLFYSFLSGF